MPLYEIQNVQGIVDLLLFLLALCAWLGVVPRLSVVASLFRLGVIVRFLGCFFTGFFLCGWIECVARVSVSDVGEFAADVLGCVSARVSVIRFLYL